MRKYYLYGYEEIIKGKTFYKSSDYQIELTQKGYCDLKLLDKEVLQ